MNLLAVQWTGCVYVLILLFFCFIAVHIFKLAHIGYRARKNLPAEKPRPEKPPEQEPVYYIVEKKKKRVRTEYSDPKRISFK